MVAYTSAVFKKYQNLTFPKGELNLNLLKNSQVQINFKLNEKSHMIIVIFTIIMAAYKCQHWTQSIFLSKQYKLK